MPTAISLRHAFLLCLTAAFCFFASGCVQPQQPPVPTGNLSIGVAFFTQPKEPSHMLAGYVVEDVPQIDEKILNDMDSLFASVLAEKSKNSFRSRESALKCSRTVTPQNGRNNNQAALRTWSAIGRCMEVDLLVVPQLLDWQERDGGSLGVVTPSRVVMDVFVVDVRNETLISRSRFDETQSALTSNLLEADKFFKRGGKWITARDLAKEGLEKAVKELRL